MALTRAERRIVGEVEELLRIGSYDWRVVEELYEDPRERLAQLKRIKLEFIRINVIGHYVFADELLNERLAARGERWQLDATTRKQQSGPV